MIQALVIKTYGDPEVCGAILDGMTRNVIPLDNGELMAVQAEVERLRAENAIRSCGDSKRFERACRELEMKYSTKPMNKLSEVFLSVWGLLWLCIYECYDYFSAWNREA